MPRTVLVPLVAVFLVATGCGGGVDPAMFSRFQRAQEAFDEAQQPQDFLRVAAQYQEILDSGLISGAVYYNQGNAFMRAGARGRAIACYRQAARYRPRDPYLIANLQNALSGVSVQSPRKPLVEYVLFWQDSLSYPEKILIDTSLGVLTFALALAGLWWQHKILKRLALGMLLLTCIFGASAVYDWYRFDVIRRGVVINDNTVARKGDSESYAPAFTQALPEGSEFRLVAQRGDWQLIALPGGQQGWIRGSDAVVY